MYRLERESFLTYPLIGLWSLLGFQAGFINSFGFLACGRFVSHVTGFGTQIGVAVGAAQYALAIELVGFPLSFILGAAFSGLMTSARIERGLKPRYDVVTLLLPIALLVAAVAGSHGAFGKFGQATSQAVELLLLFLLSFLCGMQNGCFATVTKGQIRTTHLTGISTDIGTDIARLLYGELKGLERELVIRANISRGLTFAAFAFGSIISVLASQTFEYLSLLVPASTSAIAYMTVMRISAAMDARLTPSLVAKFQTQTPTYTVPLRAMSARSPREASIRDHAPH